MNVRGLTVARALAIILVMIASGLQAQERNRVETYDDLLLRVEQMAPGFGGMFIEPDGRLAVYLLDTTRLAAARSAIESVFGATKIPAAGVHALQGQYAISQLKTWSERATALLSLEGVTLVDMDEGKNRVTIGIDNRSRMRAVERALSPLKIPRQAIRIEIAAPIHPVDRRGTDSG
jgi:hypothetical protein